MEWMAEVRSRVDARLAQYLSDKHASAARLGEDAAVLVDAVRGLTMRGGKRLRPAVIVATYDAVRGDDAPDDLTPTLDVCAALEVLQTYLLIHDDWMDGDAERRGGPSVHTALAARYGSTHLGAAVAVLAGDLASAYAWELLCRATFPEGRLGDAITAFRVMQEEVVIGQHLDLLGAADVSLMQHLKTGSYTVRGPLALGALLGGARPEHVSSLNLFGDPLGVAFQLRDDLLGTFGDPRTTGKPAGNDLRAGKRTALVAAAERLLERDARGPLDAVLGRADASSADVEAATRLLETSGARADVEAQLVAHRRAAREALAAAPISERGRARLTDLLALLTERDH